MEDHQKMESLPPELRACTQDPALPSVQFFTQIDGQLWFNLEGDHNEE